jgi:hypothetical protein
MGRYTVEITVNSESHTVLSVDATGPKPRITRLAKPAAGAESGPHINLTMLLRALGSARPTPVRAAESPEAHESGEPG